jgi:hypothetical protein
MKKVTNHIVSFFKEKFWLQSSVYVYKVNICILDNNYL